MPSLPKLTADLVLLHPPAIYEFRDRDDIYFPFLGTSGDVPITPLYEYFPVGFKALVRGLAQAELTGRIINLSTLLLGYPQLELDDVLTALDTRVVGIDLHWLVHVQGSLAVARRLRELRPDITTLFGGLTATYYADELIRRDEVDMVMRGYDTVEPTVALIRAIRDGTPLETIPNLVYKDDGGPRANDFSFLPATYGSGTDWSELPGAPPG